MTNSDALELLQRTVAKHKTKRAAAEALGISPPYLHDLLQGKRDLSDKILKRLGLSREITITSKGSTS